MDSRMSEISKEESKIQDESEIGFFTKMMIEEYEKLGERVIFIDIGRPVALSLKNKNKFDFFKTEEKNERNRLHYC